MLLIPSFRNEGLIPTAAENDARIQPLPASSFQEITLKEENCLTQDHIFFQRQTISDG